MSGNTLVKGHFVAADTDTKVCRLRNILTSESVTLRYTKDQEDRVLQCMMLPKNSPLLVTIMGKDQIVAIERVYASLSDD